MKNLYISFALLTCQLNLLSQEWRLINPDYYYHYEKHYADGSSSDELDSYTIMVDSSMDRTFWLNRTLEEDYSTYGLPLENNVFLNIPQFLLEKFTERPDGSVLFESDSSRFIIQSIHEETPWEFDEMDNIWAIADTLFEMYVYGELDSVRCLTLSSGDSLIHSKNFGIVRFPDGYGKQQYYRQIGIPKLNLGFSFPKVDEVFEFSIGDKFEYYTYNYYRPGGMIFDYTNIRANQIHQVEILDSMHIPGGIRYKTANHLRTESGECWVWGHAARETRKGCSIDPIYDSIPTLDEYDQYQVEGRTCSYINWDTVYFSLENAPYNHLSNLTFSPFPFSNEPKPELEFAHSFPRAPIFYRKRAQHDRNSSQVTPYITYGVGNITYSRTSSGTIEGSANWNYCPNRHPKATFNNKPSESFTCSLGSHGAEIILKWREGLGFTSAFWKHATFTYANYDISTTLVAYKTKRESSGTFTPMEVFCSPNLQQFSLYPNPSLGKIIIGPFDTPQNLSFSIYTLQGVLVFYTEEKNLFSKTINLSTLNPGTYLAQIKNLTDQTVFWQKFAISD